MLSNRVIPVLLVEKQGLVKTVNFSKPSYIGDPINVIKIFNDKEVDELILLDIEANKAPRPTPNFELVERVASECFMPLTYGGGISSVEHARRIFSLGVEKIAIQSAAIKNPSIIEELSAEFGKQSVVVSIDVRKNFFKNYKLFTKQSTKECGHEIGCFVEKIINRGAGEILLNSVDCDGTLSGPDLKLISYVSELCSIPLIYVGGVASLDDMKAVVSSGANAIGVGSFFVYQGPHRAVLITYPKYEVLRELFSD